MSRHVTPSTSSVPNTCFFSILVFWPKTQNLQNHIVTVTISKLQTAQKISNACHMVRVGYYCYFDFFPQFYFTPNYSAIHGIFLLNWQNPFLMHEAFIIYTFSKSDNIVHIYFRNMGSTLNQLWPTWPQLLIKIGPAKATKLAKAMNTLPWPMGPTLHPNRSKAGPNRTSTTTSCC